MTHSRNETYNMTRTEKIAAKKLDKEIEVLYRQNCSGVEIHIMDISKVFDAARAANKAGKDMKQAIIDIVEELREK